MAVLGMTHTIVLLHQAFGKPVFSRLLDLFHSCAPAFRSITGRTSSRYGVE